MFLYKADAKICCQQTDYTIERSIILKKDNAKNIISIYIRSSRLTNCKGNDQIVFLDPVTVICQMCLHNIHLSARTGFGVKSIILTELINTRITRKESPESKYLRIL